MQRRIVALAALALAGWTALERLDAQSHARRPVAIGGRRRRLHPVLAARSDQQGQRQDAEGGVAPGRLRSGAEEIVPRAAGVGQLPLDPDHGRRRDVRAQRRRPHPRLRTRLGRDPLGAGAVCADDRRGLASQPARRRLLEERQRGAPVPGPRRVPLRHQRQGRRLHSGPSATRAASISIGTIRWPASTAGPPARSSSTT